jgi:glycosyltransferase involved in cell wall biosynthesis
MGHTENHGKLAPKVTIGMPVYNGEPFIREALDSLLAQTFKEFELIISDNCSTDGTESICKDYEARDHRVRCIRQPENRGPDHNFIFVLNEARGEYFMWAAHDDVWHPHFLQELVEALDNNRDAVLAFCNFRIINYTGIEVPFKRVSWEKVFRKSKFWQIAYLIWLDGSKTYKAEFFYGLMKLKELLDSSHIISHISLFSSSDVILLIDLLLKGKFTLVDKTLFSYRIRKSGTGENKKLLRYVVNRIFGQEPGHGGNLISFLKTNREYAKGIRWVIKQHNSLPLFQRLILSSLSMIVEAWRPIKGIVVTSVRELGPALR